MTQCLSINSAVLGLEEEVEALLHESSNAAIARERNEFDRITQSYSDKIVLFGAGGMGRRKLAGLRRVGIAPIAFADNNPSIQGKNVDGIPVLSPIEAARQHGSNAVFVITIWSSFSKDRMRHRIQQLESLGCECVVPAGLLSWKFPDVFLPYFPMDLPHKVLSHAQEVRAAFKLFEDMESREEFVGQLRFRLLMDFDRMGNPKGADAYFQNELFELKPDEVFVDCGAFDGDTIADFLRVRGHSFHEIVAFEPDHINWEKLQNRLSKLDAGLRERITVLPYALGAERGVVLFPSSGSDQSRIGEGTDSIEMVTLDESLGSKHPTYIKFDIEGAELQALRGARQIIEKFRPVLAVSAYHEQSHLWQIPLLLAELCPDYAFYLRPHGAEGWDLLCYAVPKERRLP